MTMLIRLFFILFISIYLSSNDNFKLFAEETGKGQAEVKVKFEYPPRDSKTKEAEDESYEQQDKPTTELVLKKIKHHILPCLWDNGDLLSKKERTNFTASSKQTLMKKDTEDCFGRFPESFKLGETRFEVTYRKAKQSYAFRFDGLPLRVGRGKLPYKLNNKFGEYFVLIERNMVGEFILRSCTAFEGRLKDKTLVQLLDSDGNGMIDPKVHTEKDYIRFTESGTWMPWESKEKRYWHDGKLITFSSEPILSEQEAKEKAETNSETSQEISMNELSTHYHIDDSIPFVVVQPRFRGGVIRGDWVLYHKKLKFYTAISNRVKRFKLPPGEYEIRKASIMVGGKGRIPLTWEKTSKEHPVIEIEDGKKQFVDFGVALKCSKNEVYGGRLEFVIDDILGYPGGFDIKLSDFSIQPDEYKGGNYEEMLCQMVLINHVGAYVKLGEGRVRRIPVYGFSRKRNNGGVHVIIAPGAGIQNAEFQIRLDNKYLNNLTTDWK